MEKILLGEEWRSAREVVLAGFLPSRTERIGELVRPEFKTVRTFSHEGWPILILSREPLRIYSATSSPRS